MALDINTFSNIQGGFPFFKAAGHPAVAPLAQAMVARLAEMPSIAIYDPSGFAPAFAQLYPFDAMSIAHVFVQDISALGETVLGRTTQPVTNIAATKVSALLVMAFDAEKTVTLGKHFTDSIAVAYGGELHLVAWQHGHLFFRLR